jgi:hypothetical protein
MCTCLLLKSIQRFQHAMRDWCAAIVMLETFPSLYWTGRLWTVISFIDLAYVFEGPITTKPVSLILILNSGKNTQGNPVLWYHHLWLDQAIWNLLHHEYSQYNSMFSFLSVCLIISACLSFSHFFSLTLSHTQLRRAQTTAFEKYVHVWTPGCSV